MSPNDLEGQVNSSDVDHRQTWLDNMSRHAMISTGIQVDQNELENSSNQSKFHTKF